MKETLNFLNHLLKMLFHRRTRRKCKRTVKLGSRGQNLAFATTCDEHLNLSLHAFIELPKRILKNICFLEDLEEAAKVGFGVDIFVADGPEVRLQKVYLDMWEFFLQDVNVVDYFAKCEV